MEQGGQKAKSSFIRMIVFYTSVWYTGSLLSQSYELSQENFFLVFLLHL